MTHSIEFRVKLSQQFGRSLTKNSGSILLSVAVIIFLLALAAAGSAWYLRQGYELWQSSSPTKLPSTTPLQAAVLDPVVSLDPTLEHERATLQKNLITPLRQHYATKDERLVAIHVTPLPAEEVEEDQQGEEESAPPILTRVSLRLAPPDAAERTLSFRYDLTPWTPSMLDNE